MKKKNEKDDDVKEGDEGYGKTNKREGEIKEKITPITQEFGNGDLNVLRDKINELIANS